MFVIDLPERFETKRTTSKALFTRERERENEMQNDDDNIRSITDVKKRTLESKSTEDVLSEMLWGARSENEKDDVGDNGEETKKTVADVEAGGGGGGGASPSERSSSSNDNITSLSIKRRTTGICNGNGLSANRLIVTLVVALFAWMLAAAAFFNAEVSGMSFARGFFFAIDTGLSIGFGATTISCDGSSRCEMLTTVHVLVVSLLITCILGTTASTILTHKAHRIEKEERLRQESERKRRALGAHFRQAVHKYRSANCQKRRAFASEGDYYENGRRPPTSGRRKLGPPIVAISLENSAERDRERSSICTYCCCCVGYRRNDRKPQRPPSSFPQVRRYIRRRPSGILKYVCLYVLWIFLGIVYGVEHEEWSFTKSLLFSVTACSTGGVVPPEQLDDDSVVLVAFYAAVGVVVFALLVGVAGDGVLESFARQKLRRDGTLVLTTKDRRRLRAQLFGNQSRVTYASFLEYTLVKTRAVDPDVLNRARNAWNSININGDAYVSVEEMYAAQLFDLIDVNRSGRLSRAEFAALCEIIVRRQGYGARAQGEIVKRLEREFIRFDRDGNGTIDRVEFMSFVSRLETLLGDLRRRKCVSGRTTPKVHKKKRHGGVDACPRVPLGEIDPNRKERGAAVSE